MPCFGGRPAELIEMKLDVKTSWDTMVVCSYSMVTPFSLMNTITLWVIGTKECVK